MNDLNLKEKVSKEYAIAIGAIEFRGLLCIYKPPTPHSLPYSNQVLQNTYLHLYQCVPIHHHKVSPTSLFSAYT
ncbi:hypothetical protein L1887_28524 [Cichorium endivia]|nr:hypothetical protein L1887_28524 [Cichorium endivia]